MIEKPLQKTNHIFTQPTLLSSLEIDTNIDVKNSTLQNKFEKDLKATFFDICCNLDYLLNLMQINRLKTYLEQIIPEELKFLREYGLQI